jgi:hypothetical protein
MPSLLCSADFVAAPQHSMPLQRTSYDGIECRRCSADFVQRRSMPSDFVVPSVTRGTKFRGFRKVEIWLKTPSFFHCGRGTSDFCSAPEPSSMTSPSSNNIKAI